jgi:hypothetical protein
MQPLSEITTTAVVSDLPSAQTSIALICPSCENVTFPSGAKAVRLELEECNVIQGARRVFIALAGRNARNAQPSTFDEVARLRLLTRGASLLMEKLGPLLREAAPTTVGTCCMQLAGTSALLHVQLGGQYLRRYRIVETALANLAIPRAHGWCIPKPTECAVLVYLGAKIPRITQGDLIMVEAQSGIAREHFERAGVLWMDLSLKNIRSALEAGRVTQLCLVGHLDRDNGLLGADDYMTAGEIECELSKAPQLRAVHFECCRYHQGLGSIVARGGFATTGFAIDVITSEIVRRLVDFAVLLERAPAYVQSFQHVEYRINEVWWGRRSAKSRSVTCSTCADRSHTTDVAACWECEYQALSGYDS